MKRYSFYLPQFHICESNQSWGKDFTDWHSVRKNRPLYDGHRTNRISIMGEYDLSNKDVLQYHADLQKELHLDAFALYHYQFTSDSRALYRPLDTLLENPDIDFRFFLAWVNMNWTKSWVGNNSTVIHRQDYSRDTLEFCINDFIRIARDKRYEKYEDEPLLYIHDFEALPNFFIEVLQKKALEQLGVKFRLVGPFIHGGAGVDFPITYPPGDMSLTNKADLAKRRLLKSMGFDFGAYGCYSIEKYYQRYEKYLYEMLNSGLNIQPTILIGWDNTSRYRKDGRVLTGLRKEILKDHLARVVQIAKNAQCEMIFFKAFNEWAEGNVIEPCTVFKSELFDTVRDSKI